jgi:hypothetical protein
LKIIGLQGAYGYEHEQASQPLSLAWLIVISHMEEIYQKGVETEKAMQTMKN